MRAAMIIQNQQLTEKNEQINNYAIENMKHMRFFFSVLINEGLSI